MKPIELKVSEPGQLNLAALMIYEQTRKNLNRSGRLRWIHGIDFAIQFQAAQMIFTVIKNQKAIQIQNGRVPHPDATVQLKRIRLWGNPVLPLLRRQIRIRGNFLKLFRFLLFLSP